MESTGAPQFLKCVELNPGLTGINMVLKVLEVFPVDCPRAKISEVIAGDETGSIVLTLRDKQVEVAVANRSIEIHNGKIEMYANKFMRLVVDRWGKVTESNTKIAKVKSENAFNKSAVEYEEVKQDEEKQ
eukprot:TRINITY_DN249_c0_g1_i1.p1 TRINITY_DN249_c0_g1~~TRINITY_DN249_c0_g1_i1.p1  ORF type:complete len:130 (-),score=14.91 TRINITY_DN249_c0_g1_i1:48-437(-)